MIVKLSMVIILASYDKSVVSRFRGWEVIERLPAGC